MNTAATGCSSSDTSTARYHTRTQRCTFKTSPYTCFVTVRSHSGTSQRCTTAPGNSRHSSRSCLTVFGFQLLFSVPGVLSFALDWVWGIMCRPVLRLQLQRQTYKNPITTSGTLSSQCYNVENSDCYSSLTCSDGRFNLLPVSARHQICNSSN